MLTRLKMEWRLIRASRSYWTGLVLVGILTGLAFQVGWSRVRHQEDLHQKFLTERGELLTVIKAAIAEKEEERETSLDSPRMRSERPSVDFSALLNRPVNPLEENRYARIWRSAQTPSGMAHLSSSFKAWKLPTMLGVISVGESEKWPEFYEFKVSFGGAFPVPAEARTLSASRTVNPFHVSIGAFDLSTLLIVILPLVVITLTYDLLSHDREQGILPLLISQNHSVGAIMGIQLVLRILGIAGVFLLIFFTGYFVAGADVSSEMTWQCLGIFSLVVTSYVLFWGSLVWFVNSFGLSSTTNVVMLAIIWIGLVFVIPLSMAQSVARSYPVSPAGALATKEKEIQKSIQEMQAQQQLEAREMHGETTPESRRTQFARMQEIAQKGTEKLRDAMDVEVERYYLQHQQRNAAFQAWEPFSPALSLKHACDMIAGNSQSQFVGFTSQVCDYHQNYLDYFKSFTSHETRLTPSDIAEMPLFPTDVSNQNIDWQRLWWSTAMVVLWGGLFGLLGRSVLNLRLKSL